MTVLVCDFTKKMKKLYDSSGPQMGPSNFPKIKTPSGLASKKF